MWACPVCASKIAHGRTDDLEQGIRVWAGEGGAFALLTLTMRHHAGQTLADLWDGLSGAWRRLVRDGTYRRTVDALGVVGYHRTTEVTVGKNGWHVHLHVLYFLTPDQAVTGDAGAAAAGTLVARWQECVAAQGFSAVAAAQDWKVLSGSADALAGVAGYVVKSEYREAAQTRSARQVAMEVTRADLKDGRGGSRTPFAVLADLVASVESTGEVPEAEGRLWWEWETASKGRRQQVWSRGLRSRLGLDDEATDEDLAAVEVDGADLVVIDAPDWRSLARDGRAHVSLLAAAVGASSWGEALERVGRVLDARGVPYRPCAPPSECAAAA